MDYSILVAKINTLEDLFDGPRSTELTIQVNNFQKVPFVHYFVEKFGKFFTQQCNVEFFFKFFDKMLK